MLDVCLLGTAGMMPLPHRWLTASLMRYNGSSLLIDCGEGTQIAIKEKGWTFKPIDVICFTHYHADHISGLPGLLLSMGNAERTEPLTMIGPKGLERVVGALRMIAPELPFEIRYIEIMEPEADIEINGYHIHAFRVNHNITCYGYTVEIRRAGRFSVEHAKKREIPQKYWNRLQKGEEIETEDGAHYTPDMVLGAARKGIKVTYCTDTRPTESLVASAKKSDLLICEGMYAEKEKIAKAKQYKHMTFYEAAEVAKKAEVAEMWLTHMKKNGQKIIFAVVCVVIIVGLFWYTTAKKGNSAENNDDLTEVEKVITKNLEKNYPETPREVVKFYNRIITCFYDEEYTDDELYELGDQARLLMDDELLENNSRDDYFKSLKADIEDYHDKSKKIESSSVCSSDEVKYQKIDGDDCAYVTASYFVNENKSYTRTNQTYVLRKDKDGKWKILVFYQTEGDTEDE